MSPSADLALLDAKIRESSAGVRTQAAASIERLGEVIDPKTWVRAYPKTSMVVTCVGAAWLTARATSRAQPPAPPASRCEESDAAKEERAESQPSKVGVVLAVVGSAIARSLLGHAVSRLAGHATANPHDHDTEPTGSVDPTTN